MQEINQDTYSVLNELNARLRILEGKYNIMRDRLFIINENMIEHYKKLSVEMDSIKTDIKEIKESLFSLKEATRSIVKELDSFARKEHLKILEKYINLWNPLDFVTEEEVLELVKKKRKEHAAPKKKKHRSTHR